MPSNPQLDVPITLTGLFPPEDDDDDDDDETDCNDNNKDDNDNDDHHANCYEVQSLTVCDRTYFVRQYDFHSHNANCVWPGTFVLADYLLSQTKTTKTDQTTDTMWGHVLELGTATGLLAMRLHHASRVYQDGKNAADDSQIVIICDSVTTSDVDDNQVTRNVEWNYQRNGILQGTKQNDRDNHTPPPIHIPHTWGNGWEKSVQHRKHQLQLQQQQQPPIRSTFDTIVASDILLYVSAYPALVQTVTELFAMDRSPAPDTDTHERSSPQRQQQLILSWNRRMKESASFFQLMEHAGFAWKHEGNCVYTFVQVPRVE